MIAINVFLIGALSNGGKTMKTNDRLLTHGVVCDLSKGKHDSDTAIAYDILKTPIGNFWLEFNDRPIPMTVRADYPSNEEKYYVEGAYTIKPCQVDFENFYCLRICTNIDIKSARMIDTFSGEHQEGYNWQLGHYDIGISAHPFSDNDLEATITAEGMPYFIDWYDDSKTLYFFGVAWKYYVSDDDLSTCFNT